MIDLIRSKRDGKEWNKDSISAFINHVCNTETPDYQIAAVLMAIFFRGLNDSETENLTFEMANSGQKIDFSDLQSPVLDKHSTGGVGDKTSLVLMPLLAACDVKIAKLSGRGLGHTGGTLDKLSVFPGFRSDLDLGEIRAAVEEVGLVISGQTSGLVPADKRLYALRDSTATVNSIPLIVSSIMSKKIATGASALLLDVKVGNGSMFEELAQAKLAATKMVKIGNSLNLPTRAVLTDMTSPLGYAVGNALEVREAIHTLRGQGSSQLKELCLELGSRMMMMAGHCPNPDAAWHKLQTAFDSGKALTFLRRMIVNQGGDPSIIDRPEAIALAKKQHQVRAEKAGFVVSLHAGSIGRASMITGAGRLSKQQSIDLGAGILLNKKVGDSVQKDELVMTLYCSDEEQLKRAVAEAQRGVLISEKKPDPIPLIIDEIS